MSFFVTDFSPVVDVRCYLWLAMRLKSSPQVSTLQLHVFVDRHAALSLLNRRVCKSCVKRALDRKIRQLIEVFAPPTLMGVIAGLRLFINPMLVVSSKAVFR
jgi:hypothetical protein